jgi:hypothetical protein
MKEFKENKSVVTIINSDSLNSLILCLGILVYNRNEETFRMFKYVCVCLFHKFLHTTKYSTPSSYLATPL